MTAVDVRIGIQHLQNPNLSTLSAIVVDECNRLKLAYTDEAPAPQPTSEERERITLHLENDFNELQFNVGVNLVDSKKAFKALISGLDDSQNFMSLLDLHAHNPHTYPNPIGQVDLSFAMKTKEEGKDPKSA